MSFSLVVVSGGYSLAAVRRLLTVTALVGWSQALESTGLSSCGAWAK